MYYYYRRKPWQGKSGNLGVTDEQLRKLLGISEPEDRVSQRDKVSLKAEIVGRLNTREKEAPVTIESEHEHLSRQGITEEDILHFIFCLEGDE